MDINKRILKLMHDRNWTKYRLSKEAGLSNYTISLIEKRGTTPTVNTIQSICDAFGISLSQFFSEYHTKELPLTSKQRVLVDKFGGLDDETQELFLKLIDAYLKK